MSFSFPSLILRYSPSHECCSRGRKEPGVLYYMERWKVPCVFTAKCCHSVFWKGISSNMTVQNNFLSTVKRKIKLKSKLFRVRTYLYPM